MFFIEHPANANLIVDELQQIASTFQRGGFYKVKAQDNLFFFSINTLFYNNEVEVDCEVEKQTQLDWFRDTLSNSQADDKFILIYHIYETYGQDKYHMQYNFNEDDFQSEFFDIMEEYKDKIVLSLSGHDHLTDFRTHSTRFQFDVKQDCLAEFKDEEGYFLTKFIGPSVSMNKNTQSGYAIMFYDNGVVHNLNTTFLDINSTYGQPQNASFDTMSWFNVDYSYQFNLQNITGEQIVALNGRLKANNTLYLQYMTNKMSWPDGLLPSNVILPNNTWQSCLAEFTMFMQESVECNLNQGQKACPELKYKNYKIHHQFAQCKLGLILGLLIPLFIWTMVGLIIGFIAHKLWSKGQISKISADQQKLKNEQVNNDLTKIEAV